MRHAYYSELGSFPPHNFVCDAEFPASDVHGKFYEMRSTGFSDGRSDTRARRDESISRHSLTEKLGHKNKTHSMALSPQVNYTD
jgi:hypothetical protein